ncbi:glycosyltransferase [Francisella salimarina]|uniref:CgeB family protein n=1 Tax=Francisella salimarina TaxID=2599927 RepID=UPI0037514F3C
MNLVDKKFTFDVKSNKSYILVGALLGDESYNDANLIVSIDFSATELSDELVALNMLEFSEDYGYYRSLVIGKGVTLFNVSFKVPKDVDNIEVKFIELEKLGRLDLLSLSICDNTIANNYIQKHYLSSKSNQENFKKRQIYKDRWLKQLQNNILLKDGFIYRYAQISIDAVTSIKGFVLWPFNIFTLINTFVKFKQSKLAYDKWYQLKQKPLSKTIKTKHRKLFIRGEYFSLDSEKNNAMLIKYDFYKDLDIDLLKQLGFLYLENMGFFNYVDVSKDGQNTFLKQVRVPEGISKFTISFVNRYSNNKILFKIDDISPQQKKSLSQNIIQQSDKPSDKQKPTVIYSDELTQQDELSVLGWPKIENPRQKPIVLGVMDEFTTGCFEEDVCLIQPRPDNWLALAKIYKPDLVFIESAWQGNHGSWQFRVANYTNKPGDEIARLSEYCKQKNIPMIFWNKEDPVHHQKFMCTAELVSHIFTTDANMIPSYKDKTGNNQVSVLPFSAQPSLHKPKPLAGRKQKNCFAGSWYGNRHAERGAMMVWLLEAANEYGLEIYDRNYDRGIMPFPDKYKDGIRGALSYKELCQEYGKYRIFLNVNSVVDSPTMFSRRVFELMACGTPIVSTYAKGIEDFFESDAIWLVKDKYEALEAIKTLMNDDTEWRRRSLLGIREVFSKHTYAHRWNHIFEFVKSDKRIDVDPQISLIAVANNHQDVARLVQMMSTQKYQNFQLYIQPQFFDAVTMSTPVNIQVCQDFSEYVDDFANYIGWIDSDVDYQEFYLRDLVNAILYEPNAKGWAKSAGGDEFAYDRQTMNSLAIWSRDVLTAEFFDNQVASSKVCDINLYVIDSDQIELKSKDKSVHVNSKASVSKAKTSQKRNSRNNRGKK